MDWNTALQVARDVVALFTLPVAVFALYRTLRRETVVAANEVLTGLRTELRDARSELHEARAEIIAIRAELREAKDDLDQARRDRRALQDELTSMLGAKRRG